MLIRKLALLFTFVVVAPLAAQFTGTWSGPVQMRSSCASGSGTMFLALAQSGSTVNGAVMVDKHFEGCQLVAVPEIVALMATASGTSLTGNVLVPNATGITSIPFTATLSGTTLSFDSTNADRSISGTLTQLSTAPPDVGADRYSGTYTLHATENGCPLNYSGTLDGSLTQAGTYLGGTFVAGGRQGLSGGGCTLVAKPDATTQIEAQITGTAVDGYLTVPQDSGQPDVVAPFTGTFTGNTLTGSAGDASQGLTFTVSRVAAPAPPTIIAFTASPQSIAAGNSATLTWATQNATSVSIDNGAGTNLGPSGSTAVHPTTTTTYTLTATGPGGTASATTTVTVAAPGPKLSVWPGAVTMVVSSDAYYSSWGTAVYVRNDGDQSVRVAVYHDGSSFVVYIPADTTIRPGGGMRLDLTPRATGSAGVHQGHITIAVDGVQVRQVSVTVLEQKAPTRTYYVAPTAPRTDVTAPAGQNPSGAVTFSNPSSPTTSAFAAADDAAVTGLVSADVPWIGIAEPVVTIPAGGTAQVPFTIDRSNRPDGDSPAGGQSGTITLTYLNGPLAKWAGPLAASSVVAKVSISVVDVVTLPVKAEPPPQLGPGEFAYFLPGATAKPGSIGDLTLSNRSGATIPDVKMYFTAAGGTASQVGAVGPLLANSGIAFPGVVKNIFAGTATGTLQIRSSKASELSVLQTQVNEKGGRSFITALPLFRSDRGFDRDQSWVLPGVQKSDAQSTNLYLQEMSGVNATLAIEFLDAGGTVIGSRTGDTLPPFGALELRDVVPRDATTVRITNTSTAPARINGYASVVDSSTNDTFTIVQMGVGGDPMIAPAFPTGSSGREAYLNLANTSGAPVTVTATTLWPSRHRATTHAMSPTPAAAPSTVILPPFGFRKVELSDSGFVRLTGSSAVRVGGMFCLTRSTDTYGSGFAVFPSSRSLTLNDVKRFCAVDDASDQTAAEQRPLTYRSNLLLAETSGAPATVRVTLRFVFAGGSKVTGSATTSREVSLGANGVVLLNDVVGWVIGSERASFGDLRGALLDVQITAGSGTVLPFLQVVDNATGDVMMRDN